MEHTLPTFFSGVLGIYKEDGKFYNQLSEIVNLETQLRNKTNLET